MANFSASLLSSLETHIEAGGEFNPPVKSSAALEREKFPCEACAGKGKRLAAYWHKFPSTCFSCKGKGFFWTTKFDRMKSAQKRQESATVKMADKLEKFDNENPGLLGFLQGAASWNSFAASLYQQLGKNGLSEKQIAAAKAMHFKSLAKDQERAAVALSPPTFAALAKAFLSSSAHLKRPKLRLRTESGQRVVLSRCGAASKTPGHINITDGGSYGANTYFGRISPEGHVSFRDASDAVKNLLAEFDANPNEAIKVQGQRTGECCCCGRELTDAKSIASGIGPVCAEKWGF